ncbi:glutathione S-transferase family protein [Mesorhizobium sp. B2-3-5]|nr:glutathione S-transferase family protein [Mesorhizobium sp. B2-3-5]
MYKVTKVDLAAGEQRSQAHLAVNRRGTVPVLLIDRAGADKQVLTQSNAIMFFAAQAVPGVLLPEGEEQRLRVFDAFFHFVTDVISVNNASFRLGRSGHNAGATFLRDEYTEHLLASERFLTGDGFMGGNAFSVADIAAFVVVQTVAERLPWERLRRLDAWRTRIANRRAVQTAMIAFN